MGYGVCIKGSGTYVPSTVLSNQALEQRLGLEPGFIASRTGIQERRITEAGENVVSMATAAALEAVRLADVPVVDQVLVARDAILTKRALSPGLAVIKALANAGIDVSRCTVMDTCNYCPGFLHALHFAELRIRYGEIRSALVVAATDSGDLTQSLLHQDWSPGDMRWESALNSEVLHYSIPHHYQDPKLNAFLWGSGAAAVVLERSERDLVLRYDVRASRISLHETFGLGEDRLGNGFCSLDGGAVYKFAMREVTAFIRDFLHSNGVAIDNVVIVPHQPNPRMLSDLLDRLGNNDIRMEQTCSTFGNMVAASVPFTYHRACQAGRIKEGEQVFLCSFGDSYLTVAGLLFEHRAVKG
jgi:3-oxoacyl-[acyl-carrier-protein] synthase III